MDMRQVLACVVLAGCCLAVPERVFGQPDAAIIVTVTDESRAVLPGVNVAVAEVNTGRAFSGVTDERGEYNLPRLMPGTYKLQAELTGFATVVMTVTLLVGQQAVLPMTLKVAALQETVTVSTQAPLVDVSAAQVAGNVDRRQMEALPLQGRNWQELAMLIKGITVNSVTNRPVGRDEDFQLNLDGQQITYRYGGSGFGQPRFSRDAIAEFQVVTNLFDVTQGRSTGIQVQAISRSGTNTASGSVYGYFRDDTLNAKDFVAGRVLPYQNQQLGGTLGGPIRRDRLLYFGSFEYEREPATIFLSPTRLPGVSYEFENRVTQKNFLGRVDHVVTPTDTVSYRASTWRFNSPTEFGSSTQYPSQAYSRGLRSMTVQGEWSSVLSQNLVQQVKVGFNRYHHPTVLKWDSMLGISNYQFPGITFGAPGNFPQDPKETTYSTRYDLSWNRGTHHFKLGGEFLYIVGGGRWAQNGRGTYIFSANLSDAEFLRRFPADAYSDPTRWDLTGLDSLAQEFRQNTGDFDLGGFVWPTLSLWFGDTWRIQNRLTLIYGVRWDDDFGWLDPPDVTNTMTFTPFGGPMFATGMSDHDNIGPRAGFTYDATGAGSFILRGGTGLYFTTPIGAVGSFDQGIYANRLKSNVFPNDRLPGFIGSPTRGFTQEQIAAGNVPQFARPLAREFEMPYAVQSSIGFQKQIGRVTGFDLDLTHIAGRHQIRAQDVNLFLDPQTGYNLDPSVFSRPDPNWSQVDLQSSTGRSELLNLAGQLTRRFSNRFQSSVTYTHQFRNHGTGGGLPDNQFNPEAEWGPTTGFQRHTLRASGILELPWDFSVSGAYFYGSGARTSTTISGRPFNKPGTNRLNVGAPIAIPENLRDRFDGPAIIGTGEVVPINALRDLPLHKVDMRVAKNIRLGKLRIIAIAEVFNLFNHANYGGYVGQVNSVQFGQLVQAQGNAYAPRSGQLAFRVQF